MSKHFEDMTLPELEAERAHWEAEMDNATGWGASYAAANGFRLGCIAWIARHKAEHGQHVDALNKVAGL